MKKIHHMPVSLRKFVLAQHTCGGCRAYLRTLPWLVKGAAALCTCREECNKYDLTAAQSLWLADDNDWSKWFAITSPPPICCLSFSFMGWVAKEYITKLGCEKYFRRLTYWAPVGMLLVKKVIMTRFSRSKKHHTPSLLELLWAHEIKYRGRRLTS
jgi:hypothetical protein